MSYLYHSKAVILETCKYWVYKLWSIDQNSQTFVQLEALALPFYLLRGIRDILKLDNILSLTEIGDKPKRSTLVL